MKKVLSLCLTLMLSALSAFAQTYPYQDPNRTPEERVADLCSRLTLEEKVSLMRFDSKAIDRLGIPKFNWWSEALHGVGRNGIATIFPSCIGMASSFDDALLAQIYTAVSDEARAKYNIAKRQNKVGHYSCLSFWTPTINIFRDPRWGRGQESYGEDPYLNGRMGSIVVRALQGTLPTSHQPSTINHQLYKLLACAKHFAVHSGPEKTRHQMNIEDLTPRDLWETYLPAFKTLVQEAGVQEVMCAYQRYDGQPCCGNNRLLKSILRDEWGFQGMVVSDCWAVTDFWSPGRHGVSADSPAAASKAVLAGTDVECGVDYKNLPEAVKRGDIRESDIDVSVKRLLRGRFSLGELDPDSLNPWAALPDTVVNCQNHRQLARQMAREQMVLLKNNGILPLKKTNKDIMVMGPNAADSTMLWGIYFGKASHTVTPLEGIEAKVGTVPFVQGCSITNMTAETTTIAGSHAATDGSTTLEQKVTDRRTFTIPEILRLAKKAKTIIFVGGITPNLEREEAQETAPGFDHGDRTTIELPQVQRDILKALHDAGKRVVLVNCSGSAVALEQEDRETCDAILEAWYAGEQGGHALADVLFGDFNPQGKLPVTFYRNDSQLPPFDDYSMKNRTYRYFQGSPLYPFGYGLSYTSFEYGAPAYRDSTVTVTIKNTGKRTGTEVVQVYMRRPADVDGPQKSLRGYVRVTLQPGEAREVTIPFPRQRFENWDATTNTMRVVPGDYELLVGSSSRAEDLQVIHYKL